MAGDEKDFSERARAKAAAKREVGPLGGDTNFHWDEWRCWLLPHRSNWLDTNDPPQFQIPQAITKRSAFWATLHALVRPADKVKSVQGSALATMSVETDPHDEAAAWSVHKTAEGRRFYVNAVTKKRVWKKPTALARKGTDNDLGSERGRVHSDSSESLDSSETGTSERNIPRRGFAVDEDGCLYRTESIEQVKRVGGWRDGGWGDLKRGRRARG